jgi:hypothetical protein
VCFFRPGRVKALAARSTAEERQQNLDDTGNQSVVNDMEPLAQGIITEQCIQYSVHRNVARD